MAQPILSTWPRSGENGGRAEPDAEHARGYAIATALDWNSLRKNPGQPRRDERDLPSPRRDQAGDGRGRCDDVMQRSDAARDHTHPANRNGYGGVVAAAPAQISGRNQRHHESAELS